MLHLAFSGRALLADEMGLARPSRPLPPARCLHRPGPGEARARSHPASLKTRVGGTDRRASRRAAPNRVTATRRNVSTPTKPPRFFTLVNYEQDAGRHARCECPSAARHRVLDEAQRIKNWASKTAPGHQAAAQSLCFRRSPVPRSRTAFGRNSTRSSRSSIRRFSGRFSASTAEFTGSTTAPPRAYLQLQKVHERIRPILLRRRKARSKGAASRTDRNLFIASPPRNGRSTRPRADPRRQAVQIAKRRPLSRRNSSASCADSHDADALATRPTSRRRRPHLPQARRVGADFR